MTSRGCKSTDDEFTKKDNFGAVSKALSSECKDKRDLAKCTGRLHTHTCTYKHTHRAFTGI